MTERNTGKPSVRYVPLSRLKINTKVDVYGVVKFFKQPYKSRGSDYCTMISIVDQSYTDPLDKLKCLLFAKEMSKLPLVKVGHIIRFHRLSISEFAGSLQGQNSPGFSWLLFSGEVGSPLEPIKSSSLSYSITDNDREMVKELRSWRIGKDDLQAKLCTFSEVAVGGYFDLVCQVVQTSVIETDVGRLLKVWDGTQCIYDVRNMSAECEEQNVHKDDKLLINGKGFLYDVCVFDDHFMSSRNIKPGDFVKFINLHAAEYKSNIRDSNHAVVEFVLHRGDSFGRCVQVINPDNVDLNTMKQRQEIIAMENETESQIPEKSTAKENQSQIPEKTTGLKVTTSPPMIREADDMGRKEISVQLNDFSEMNEELHKKTERPRPETPERCERTVKALKRTNEKEKSGETSNASASDPRCMAQSSTVILGHPHTERRKIKDVLELNVPDKSRVRAKVYDYHPKANTVTSFLKLYCSVCHYLCSYPVSDGDNRCSNSQLQIGSTFKGIPHYNCPQCLSSQDTLHGLDSPPHLKFIYMLRFILWDNSGMLMANIWKENAVQFFHEIDPEDLLKNESMFGQIRDCLVQLCPADKTVEERPWIECCLQSYSVAEGTGYQIFDTTVV